MRHCISSGNSVSRSFVKAKISSKSRTGKWSLASAQHIVIKRCAGNNRATRSWPPKIAKSCAEQPDFAWIFESASACSKSCTIFAFPLCHNHCVRSLIDQNNSMHIAHLRCDMQRRRSTAHFDTIQICATLDRQSHNIIVIVLVDCHEPPSQRRTTALLTPRLRQRAVFGHHHRLSPNQQARRDRATKPPYRNDHADQLNNGQSLSNQSKSRPRSRQRLLTVLAM